MTANYTELSELAERGELKPIPGTKLTGKDAADQAQGLLMEATETDTIDDMYRVALGRPPVGSKGGASPTVRTRVPQSLKDAISAKAKKEDRTESEIMRAALVKYVASQ